MTFVANPEDAASPAQRLANPIAWHYTGPEGLIGIVSSGRLWASAPAILNDREEMLYGFNIMLNEWRALREDASISDAIRDFLDETLSEEWLSSLMDSVFIVSASSSAELVSQWLNYAGADGFAIGLDRATMWLPAPRGATEIRASDLTAAFSVGPIWLEVEYDQLAQRATARSLLESAVNVAGREATDWTRSLLRLQTANGIATFKHPAFSAEREIRLAVPRVDDRVLFRASGGRLIPYSEVAQYRPDPDTQSGHIQRLPIVEVICSPRTEGATMETVARLLRANGYNEVEVSRSALPLA